jgi:D-alanyl-D-alanine carboxypeptidase
MKYNYGRKTRVLATTALNAVLALGFVAQAGATDALSAKAKVHMKPYGASSSFCYIVENGEMSGVNADQPVRIASVMKTLTTLWAVDTYGPTHEYSTKIYYQPSTKELHIQGVRDPFFDRDRLYLLLSDLNKAGIKQLNRLTFDGAFLLNLDLFEFAYDPSRTKEFMYTEAHADGALGRVKIKEKMETAFNTKEWWSSKKTRYQMTRSRNSTSGMVPVLEMTTTNVDVVPSNPLAGKPGVQVYEIKSRPLMHYLKKMNIHSLNATADELFYSMGGSDAFIKFLGDKYRMGTDAVDVHTGSGLPLHDPRNDTSMSCSSTVKLIRRLDIILESQGLDLADVMMIAGLDAGATFKDGSQALVVKTGSLTGVKNLAGVANTTSGEVYFGVFLQNGGNTAGARNVVADLKGSFKMQPVHRAGFVWDPLDPKMALRPVQANRVVVTNR